MLAAKSAQAHEALQGLLHTGQFVREYLALTRRPPEPPAGTIDAPLGPVPGALNRYRVDPAGKPARTDYETLDHNAEGTLLRLKLHTGRTHQILSLIHISLTNRPGGGSLRGERM